MIIEWEAKVAEYLHRPFDAEFSVGDKFEFVLPFRFQTGSPIVGEKSSKMGVTCFGAQKLLNRVQSGKPAILASYRWSTERHAQ